MVAPEHHFFFTLKLNISKCNQLNELVSFASFYMESTEISIKNSSNLVKSMRTYDEIRKKS